MRNVLWLPLLVAGCSEYELGGGGLEIYDPTVEDPAGEGTGDTTDDAPDGDGDGDGDGDEPPPPDGDEPPPDGDEPPPDEATDPCYEPEDGYDTNPAARLIVTDASPVSVRYLGYDSGYTNELWLDAPSGLHLAVTGETAPDTLVGTRTFVEGAELVFGIRVRNTGDHFQSGPASRNADGVVHVAVTYEGACTWTIGFEDLWGGGDLDFNDTRLEVSGPLRQDD